MKKNGFLFTLLLICAISGCTVIDDWFDFEAPEVKAINPSNHAQGIENRPNIYIEFSKSMDKPKTEQAFSISSDRGIPKGYFRWSEKTLHYDLVEDLENGGVYTIKVATSAEDTNGNNLLDLGESRFYVGQDFLKPRAVSYTIRRSAGTNPETLIPLTDGMRGILQSDEILIEFSEPILYASTENGFSLSPRALGKTELIDNNTTLKFTPFKCEGPLETGSTSYGFQPRTYYEIILTKEITDLSGNPLLEEQKRSFMAGDDITHPTLYDQSDPTVGVFARFNGTDVRLQGNNLNDGIMEKNSDIRITFNEPMRRNDTGDAIAITPAIDYELVWSTDKKEIVIGLIHNAIYELGRIYTISIKNSALDASNNNLDSDYSFSFKINGPHSQSLSIASIEQLPCNTLGPNPENPFRWPLNTLYDPIMLVSSTQANEPPAYFNPSISGNPNMYVIRIIFENRRGDQNTRKIDIYSALNAVKFTYDSYYGDEIDADGNLHVTKHPVIWKIDVPENMPNAVDLYIFNLEPKNYYKLTVSSGRTGLSDDTEDHLSDGNYLLEDFITYFSS